jgi:uncharacterized membrane protein
MKTLNKYISDKPKTIGFAVVGLFAIIAEIIVICTSDGLYSFGAKSWMLAFLTFVISLAWNYGAKTIINEVKAHKKTSLLFVVCIGLAIAIALRCLGWYPLSSIVGKYIFVIQLVMIPVVILGMLGIFIWKLKYWKLYLLIGTFVGLGMMLVMPIGGVPDEVVHINSAYRISNFMLGISNTADSMPMRMDDFNMLQHSYAFSQYHDIAGFESYITQLLTPLNNSSLVVAQTSHVSPYFCYLFPAIGITIGRLFGLGCYQTFMIGRLLNFAIFMLLTAYAVSVIPVWKLPMIILLLMPMTVQQGMSYSYDVYVNGLSMIAIAYAVKIALTDSKPFLSKKEIIILALSTCLLLPIKHFSYFLISFLPWMILFWKIHPLKEDTINHIKKIIAACVILLIIAIVIWGLTGASSYKYSDIYLSYDPTEAGYSIGYFIAHPFELLPVCINTITRFGRFYLYSFAGESLGWLDLELPKIISIGFFVILFLSVLKRKDSIVNVPKKVKKLFAIVAVLTICFIFAGLLLCWSPISGGCILGVQGRYFIPVGLLLLLLLYSDDILIDKRVDKYLLATALMLIFFAIEYIILRY